MWTRFFERYGDLTNPENLETCLQAMLAHKPIRDLDPDLAQIRDEFYRAVPSYGRLFALIHAQYASRRGKRRWGDQLAYVERFTEIIFKEYPDARMVHMIRDPRSLRGTGSSNQGGKPGRAGWSTARWLHDARLAEVNRQLYPDRYCIVAFEALQAQPRETLAEICEFLGEEVVPEMGTFLETVQPLAGEEEPGLDNLMGHNRGMAATGKEKVEHTPAGLFTQTMAGRYLQLFGYPNDDIRLPLPRRVKYFLIDFPANILGMAAWYSLESRKLRRVKSWPAAG
jgi:hypothetical protein